MTPVFQFELVSVTLVGECVIAVLPERVIVTGTEPVGAALKRIDDVPLVPPASDNVLGVAVMDSVGVPWIVNGTAAVAALNDGEPLSNAVACAVWLPEARPVALKLYGELVSVATRLPSTRNSTRVTAPPGSPAVAASVTAEPEGNICPLVGLVRLMVGAVLPVPPPVQAVPFNVKPLGAEFVVVNVPLKPMVNVAPLPMFCHDALLDTVTCALPAGCENDTGQPFWMRSPFWKVNTSVQFETAGPVLRMAMLAP